MPTEDSASETRSPHSLKKALLCTIHEAESWQQENQYLIGHYRTTTYSYRTSFASLGYLHNQTSNIYTHLFGTVLFMSWAVQTYNDLPHRYSTWNLNDLFIFTIFFASSLFCFGTSALFHLFMDGSIDAHQTWLLLDLYGVFGLIIATVVSGTYYGFYCEPFWWKVYSEGILFITLTFAGLCSMPRFRHSKWRNMRTFFIVSIGFYGCLPMTHFAQKWGRPMANEKIGWNLMFLEGMSYVAGASIYAFRIPERWSPGKFDIWGASHQIFHICAVLGAALHYRALVKGFSYSHNPASQQC